MTADFPRVEFQCLRCLGFFEGQPWDLLCYPCQMDVKFQKPPRALE